jgi:hypothetical protein
MEKYYEIASDVLVKAGVATRNLDYAPGVEVSPFR